MSVSSTTNRVTYAGNGATTAFSFPYYFQVTSDLVVKGYNTSTGAIASYALTTDYTVSGTFTSNQGYLSGGTVTMLVAPATGTTLVIYRDPTLTQTLTLVENDIVPATSVNAEFDKVTLIAQRTKDMVSRAMRLDDGFAGTFSTTLPTPVVATAALVSDATGAFLTWGAPGSGTASVSSVGLSAPSIFAVAGTPVTAAGTLALTLNTQSQNTFFAGLASGTGTPAFRAIAAADIPSNLITNAMSAQMATNTIKGNNTGGTANASDLTGAQVAAILPAVVGDSGSGGTKGLVPAPASGDAAASKFLKADGTWAAPAGAGTVTSASVVSANGFAGTVANPTSTPAITLTTSITGVLKGNATAISAATSGTDYSAGTSALGTGILKSTTTTGALTIAIAADFPTLNQNTSGSAASVSGTNIVTNSNLSQMAAYTVKGNNTGSTANAIDMTLTQARALLHLPPNLQNLTSGSTYGTAYWFIISSGNATLGATYTNNTQTFTVVNTVASATQVLMTSTGAPTASGTLTKATGTGDSTLTFSAALAPLSLRVEMVGGGGGGSGSGLDTGLGGTGGNGGNTTFGSSLLTANGGTGGIAQSVGSSGGSGTVAAPAIGAVIIGGQGTAGNRCTNNTIVFNGGMGGSSYFGGGGSGGQGGVGSAGSANTGAGGGGGSGFVSASGQSTGTGGSAGGTVKAVIQSPSATYSIAIGTAGTAGTAGTSGSAGGAGAAGRIIVEELFQ